MKLSAVRLKPRIPSSVVPDRYRRRPSLGFTAACKLSPNKLVLGFIYKSALAHDHDPSLTERSESLTGICSSMAALQLPSMDPALVASMESALAASKEAYAKFFRDLEGHQIKFFDLSTEFFDLHNDFMVISAQHESDLEAFELIKKQFEMDLESHADTIEAYCSNVECTDQGSSFTNSDNVNDAESIHEQRAELFQKYQQAYASYVESFTKSKKFFEDLKSAVQNFEKRYAPD